MSLRRAYTTVILAMSADGKIADRDRTAARFSSAQDLAHLEAETAIVDGVLFGAGTLRAYGTCLPVRNSDLIAQRKARGQPEQPVQIVCSESGRIDPELRFFRQPVPRWLLTTAAGASPWRSSTVFEQIVPLPTRPTEWEPLLQTLYRMGIEHLAVLGGGRLVANLVEQDLIDELHLTVCPLLIGGKQAPTPVDGAGLSLKSAVHLNLVQVNAVDDEVFLHYRRPQSTED